MITIGKAEVTIANGKARMSAPVSVDGVAKPLWIEVDEKFAVFLTPERSDAYVLGLLQYAMRHGHDITCETAMTERLHEQLNEQFLSAFYKANHRPGPKIWAPLASEVDHPSGGGRVGTGCSCGVDSLHVFAAHPDVNVACIWNMHGVTVDETAAIRERGWQNMLRLSGDFAREAGCELLVADSNFDRGCIPDLMFDGAITYGNLFFAFALQKLWKKYYIASGYDVAEYRMNVGFSSDPAHYEYMMLAFCSLKNIMLRLDGTDRNRFEKVQDLCRYPLARKYLNVCWRITEDGRNCTSGCAKCMRTLLEIDAANALDAFADVFDIDYYRSHHEEFLAEYYRQRLLKSPFAHEVAPCFASKYIPFFVKVRAMAIVGKKIVKKVLRGGKTDTGNFKSR